MNEKYKYTSSEIDTEIDPDYCASYIREHACILINVLDRIEALEKQNTGHEKQKTGHWRFRKREGNECVYRCSNCGRKITKYDGFCDFERLFAYCPECGVKMEGDKE